MGMAAHVSARRYGPHWLLDLVFALTLVDVAFAQQSQIHFSIAAQPMSSALLQLGHQADISIAFNHALVDGKSG